MGTGLHTRTEHPRRMHGPSKPWNGCFRHSRTKSAVTIPPMTGARYAALSDGRKKTAPESRRSCHGVALRNLSVTRALTTVKNICITKTRRNQRIRRQIVQGRRQKVNASTPEDLETSPILARFRRLTFSRLHPVRTKNMRRICPVCRQIPSRPPVIRALR